MEYLIKQLWQRAVTERSKKISHFAKDEKIRLKHELEIIKKLIPPSRLYPLLHKQTKPEN